MSSSAYSRRTPVIEYEPFKPVALQPYIPIAWESSSQPSWDRAKLALRIVSTIMAVPLLGVSVFGFWAPYGFNYYPILGTPMGAVVFSYDLAEYIVMCAKRRKSGVQPKVSLGFELIISLGGLATSVLLIFSAIHVWGWHPYYEGASYGIPISDFNGNRYFWFGMTVGASVLGVFISLIHFILFVRDCVEVDRQRKAENYGRWMASTIPIQTHYPQQQPPPPPRKVDEPVSPDTIDTMDTMKTTMTMVANDDFECNMKFRMDEVKHD
ncbi:hypothetical protein GGS26DRAFT_585883 [Hypomontagnella submonticulosa]|nr:hypothetical protein GGS26DRAFT_585883 [Hypomontagnella submonticulosa]